MTDTPETGTPPAPETEAEPQAQTQTPETGESAEARIAAMAAALKKANAESAAHRKRLEAIEKAEQDKKNAELSELEQIRKHLAEAEAKAAALERSNLQRLAADKYKLPAALVDRLKGETLEELEADAADLAKTLPKSTPPSSPGPVPPANPGAGAAPPAPRKRAGPVDIFDPQRAAQHGGGLIVSNKE